MIELILATLLWMPPYYYEEKQSLEARRERLRSVAAEIARETSNLDEIAAVLTLGEAETHFAIYVGEGRCSEGRFKCDPDFRGRPQARTYWQLWVSTCPMAWRALEGSPEELRAAVKCALDRWRFGLGRCKSLVGAFSAYRAGDCAWKGAPERAKRYGEVLAQLNRLSGRKARDPN
jgi:hypothetical protein